MQFDAPRAQAYVYFLTLRRVPQHRSTRGISVAGRQPPSQRHPNRVPAVNSRFPRPLMHVLDIKDVHGRSSSQHRLTHRQHNFYPLRSPTFRHFHHMGPSSSNPSRWNSKASPSCFAALRLSHPYWHTRARLAQSRSSFHAHSHRQPDSVVSSIVSRLLQNAAERLRMQLVSRMSRHCYEPRLERVLELPVTSSLPGQIPSSCSNRLIRSRTFTQSQP